MNEETVFGRVLEKHLQGRSIEDLVALMNDEDCRAIVRGVIRRAA